MRGLRLPCEDAHLPPTQSSSNPGLSSGSLFGHPGPKPRDSGKVLKSKLTIGGFPGGFHTILRHLCFFLCTITLKSPPSTWKMPPESQSAERQRLVAWGQDRQRYFKISEDSKSLPPPRVQQCRLQIRLSFGKWTASPGSVCNVIVA